MTVDYQQPKPVSPLFTCYRCGCTDFIRHENEPGKPTILECSACRSHTLVNITTYITAAMHMENEEVHDEDNGD